MSERDLKPTGLPKCRDCCGMCHYTVPGIDEDGKVAILCSAVVRGVKKADENAPIPILPAKSNKA